MNEPYEMSAPQKKPLPIAKLMFIPFLAAALLLFISQIVYILGRMDYVGNLFYSEEGWYILDFFRGLFVWYGRDIALCIVLSIFLLRKRPSLLFPILFGALSLCWFFDGIYDLIVDGHYFFGGYAHWTIIVTAFAFLLKAPLLLAEAVFAGMILKKPADSKARNTAKKLAFIPPIILTAFWLLERLFWIIRTIQFLVSGYTPDFSYWFSGIIGFLPDLLMCVGIVLICLWLAQCAPLSKTKAAHAPQPYADPQYTNPQYTNPQYADPQYAQTAAEPSADFSANQTPYSE